MRAKGAAFLSLVAIAGCTATPESARIFAASEAEQVAALQACQEQLGIYQQLEYQRADMGDGRLNIFIVNGNGLTLAQAREINACKDARIMSGEMSPAAIYDDQTYGGKYGTSGAGVGTDTASRRSFACPPHADMIHGGALYCPKEVR